MGTPALASDSSTLPFPWLSGLGGCREGGGDLRKQQPKSFSDSDSEPNAWEISSRDLLVFWKHLRLHNIFGEFFYGIHLSHFCSLPGIQSLFFFFGYTCGMWKFTGQGREPAPQHRPKRQQWKHWNLNLLHHMKPPNYSLFIFFLKLLSIFFLCHLPFLCASLGVSVQLQTSLFTLSLYPVSVFFCLYL